MLTHWITLYHCEEISHNQSESLSLSLLTVHSDVTFYNTRSRWANILCLCTVTGSPSSCSEWAETRGRSHLSLRCSQVLSTHSTHAHHTHIAAEGHALLLGCYAAAVIHNNTHTVVQRVIILIFLLFFFVFCASLCDLNVQYCYIILSFICN